MVVPSAPIAGTILCEKYELLERLGAGGMGEVWRAQALDLQAIVAIKLLKSESSHASARARFQQETQAAAALRSPHVVQVLGYGVDEIQPGHQTAPRKAFFFHE